MFGIQDLTLFILSGLLLNMAPGPDSVLIMTRSATQGWRAGSAAALGIAAGTCVHVLAAALGLSALLTTSAWAFTLIKYLGAAYLIYLGLTLLMRRTAQLQAATAAASGDSKPTPLSRRKIFTQGFLSNALNPKVALFFLAFVPQFIAPDAPNKALAFVVLGLIFNINSLLWCHALALFTALASRRLRLSARVTDRLNRGIGALFLAFGIKLALARAA
jgi:RhtB (resistance to homoserine/threonine) family protein